MVINKLLEVRKAMPKILKIYEIYENYVGAFLYLRLKQHLSDIRQEGFELTPIYTRIAGNFVIEGFIVYKQHERLFDLGITDFMTFSFTEHKEIIDLFLKL